MWINPTSQQTYTLHSDIRNACPQVSLPSDITDTLIIELGLMPLMAVEPPAHDPMTQTAMRDGCELVAGQWRYKWTVVAHDAATIAANAALARAELIARSSVVSMRQARLEMLRNGLLDAVNSAVAQMPTAAQIEWEYATEVQRGNSLVAEMQVLLAWTDSQMDEFFISAYGL